MRLGYELKSAGFSKYHLHSGGSGHGEDQALSQQQIHGDVTCSDRREG